MATSSEQGLTRVWHCEECGARNVTYERDVFSDQCRNCTCYNEIDWSDVADVTLAEAAAVAEKDSAE